MIDVFSELKKDFNKKFVKTGCVNDLDLGLFWGWIIENFVPAETMVMPKIVETTRLVVVDHRTKITDGMQQYGRAMDVWNVSVELSLQDNGRTLKVFLKDR